MDAEKYTERQINIADNLRVSGWDDGLIEYELPAVERIVDDVEGVKPSRYSAKRKPVAESYVGKSTQSHGVANALLDNLSQRVMGELDLTQANFQDVRGVDIARAIAVGAQSIKEHSGMWQGLGIMDAYYNDADVIESRYAMSAKMLNQFIKDNPFPSGEELGGNQPKCDVCPDMELDMSMFVKLFKEWMDAMEHHMKIISKEIDRTIGAPTSRIKHLKIYTPDGDRSDVTDLDLSHFNQITSESLALFAGDDMTMAMLSLDDMTMTEQFVNETRRMIDVFILDKSISMAGVPILQAASFLFNRLQKVVDGFAMLAIVTFAGSAETMILPPEIAKDKPAWLIDTKEKAKWAQVAVIEKYTSAFGSSTNIPLGVNRGIELAHKMEEFGGILPNITVVTDNDRSIGNLDIDTIDIPVNGLALKDNTTLQDFCVKTGGSYNNLQQIEINVAILEAEQK